MELILFSGRIVYWLFIAPIWWVASYLAAIFYPFEGDSANWVLTLVFTLLIGGGIIAALVFLA